MDGAPHPLTLKVMRVSRPTLASAWQPFFSSSPSFSAHSTASVLSLQGSEPLPGYPKTLRDLTHAPEILTLPSSFGTIQLGETFSSCMCINNEATLDVEGIAMKVEMQTATNKTLLADIVESRLAVGDTLETVVHHEMKELGQHVLACIVSYRVPPGARHAMQSSNEQGTDPSIQTFRKFYKFAVTNPLSVKTKVHVPRSPTAQLSKEERDKIFLEVHIQNLTQVPMWFDRMRFEALDNWQVEDGNVNNGESIFSGPAALMHPQDLRQYIYILAPTPGSATSFPEQQTPGSIIPLGRLDISWRSSFGEPGRLLTSILSRRIPLPPPPPTVSALPPYLQKAAGPVISRPGSPQLAQQPQRTSTPPAGTPAPYRRISTPPSRPQSPGATHTHHPTVSTSAIVPVPPLFTHGNIDVDLVVKHIPYDAIHVEQPFSVDCVLNVSADLPPAPTRAASPSSPTPRRKDRVLSLVVQHVQPARSKTHTHNPLVPPSTASGTQKDALDSQMPSSGFSTPSPTATPWRGNFNYNLTERLLMASPRAVPNDNDIGEGERLDSEDGRGAKLPAPFAMSTGEDKATSDVGVNVMHAGMSALYLPTIRLSQSPESKASTPAPDATVKTTRGEAKREFTLSFIPLQRGFAKIGSLRVLVAVDREIEEGEFDEVTDVNGIKYAPETRPEARVVREWDVIGEVWVK